MRLVKVTREKLTILREKRGKGFCYRDASGAVVCEVADKVRIKALGIPPAWRQVRIAAHARAHIQVVGIDEAGRDQYIYHPEWELRRDGKKLQRLALLTSALPRLRKRLAEDLKAPEGSRTLALAIAVALIDKTAMRVGREKYLETSGTRGAGTLYARDVSVKNGEVCLTFDAKGGKRAEYCLADGPLADAVLRIKPLPGKRLLVFKDETNKVRPIKTPAINAYLRELSGVDISAKDFRTLHASAMAGEALAGMDVATSQTGRRKQMAQVARQVSEVLRNTPAISRKSYIAPCLFKLFDEGKLKPMWDAAGRGRAGLLTRERRLGVVLAAVS